jgi:transcription initiation factor IIF auxiliary subunit
MRAWSIEIWLLNDQGQEVSPNCFEKVTYNLHPSFDKNKQGKSVRERRKVLY